MIYLLYSADYELYLGENYVSEEKVLVQPTDRLLDQCESLGIPMTLFCDVACLWRYRELGREAFPDTADEQLRSAIRRGHDVQSHLHPHWMHTTIDGRRFKFEPSQYLFGTLSEDPEVLYEICLRLLRRSSEYLRDLLGPIADYDCVAFRAGGYGLQPQERLLLQALEDAGFLIDSSIIPGFTRRSRVQNLDFSRVPDLPNYWLSKKSGLSLPAEQGEGLFEVPIPSTTLGKWEACWLQMPEALRSAMRIVLGADGKPPARGRPCFGGSPAPSGVSRLKRAYWRAQSILDRRFVHLELNENPRLLLACLERYLKRFVPLKGDVYVSMNCHPKGLTERKLRALRTFHRTLQKRYGEELRAVSFLDTARRLRSSRAAAFPSA